jgi:hypothetical protein
MSDLIVPCPKCGEARAALLALYNAVTFHRLELHGAPILPHSTYDSVELSVRELTVKCATCKDTRYLFTREGRTFMQMIVKGVDDEAVEAFLVKESTV